MFDPDAPSSQMLRYLSRVDVASDRALKWGVLTNGAVWRLYWQDARSRSEDFFELDLAQALALPGTQPELDAPAPAHALRLFHLFFSRDAFLPQPWDAAGRTRHQHALNEARLYEEKVSQDLGARVFNEVFPQLADALTRDDLAARRHLSLQFKDDVLVGCNSVGWTEHVGVMRGMVEGQLRLGPWKDALLADPTCLMEAYLAAAQGQGQWSGAADTRRR